MTQQQQPQTSFPTETVKELVSNGIEISTNISTHKQTLIKIVLDTITDDQKVAQLCRSILEFRSGKFTDAGKSELPDSKYTKVYNEFSTFVANASIGEIDGIRELMEMVLSPACDHISLIDKIANHLRDDNMTPNRKVELISRLLM